jgi:predicted HD phosphohydrolase
MEATRPEGLDVVGLFARLGARAYGDRVSQLSHALQCAAQACRDHTDDELVAAALLHDLGHFLAGGPETAQRHHGTEAAAVRRPFVPSRVAWLIRQHVVAKRYLCTVDPRYRQGLSPASRRSLEAQGGTVPDAERLAIEAHPWFADALRLRRWDDAAKRPQARVPPLRAYHTLLERYFGPQSQPLGPGLDC